MPEAALKSFAIWMAILALAFANGIFREAVLIPLLGSKPGLILSGALLSALILITAYMAAPWLALRQARHLWLVGLGWLTLTVLFEFLFGLLRGQALAQILQAYTFAGGNLWPLVLGITALAPRLAARVRGWR